MSSLPSEIDPDETAGLGTRPTLSAAAPANRFSPAAAQATSWDSRQPTQPSLSLRASRDVSPPAALQWLTSRLRPAIRGSRPDRSEQPPRRADRRGDASDRLTAAAAHPPTVNTHRSGPERSTDRCFSSQRREFPVGQRGPTAVYLGRRQRRSDWIALPDCFASPTPNKRRRTSRPRPIFKVDQLGPNGHGRSGGHGRAG